VACSSVTLGVEQHLLGVAGRRVRASNRSSVGQRDRAANVGIDAAGSGRHAQHLRDAQAAQQRVVASTMS
jgi:hypothetical protein